MGSEGGGSGGGVAKKSRAATKCGNCHEEGKIKFTLKGCLMVNFFFQKKF